MSHVIKNSLRPVEEATRSFESRTRLLLDGDDVSDCDVWQLYGSSISRRKLLRQLQIRTEIHDLGHGRRCCVPVTLHAPICTDSRHRSMQGARSPSNPFPGTFGRVDSTRLRRQQQYPPRPNLSQVHWDNSRQNGLSSIQRPPHTCVMLCLVLIWRVPWGCGERTKWALVQDQTLSTVRRLFDTLACLLLAWHVAMAGMAWHGMAWHDDMSVAVLWS